MRAGGSGPGGPGLSMACQRGADRTACLEMGDGRGEKLRCFGGSLCGGHWAVRPRKRGGSGGFFSGLPAWRPGRRTSGRAREGGPARARPGPDPTPRSATPRGRDSACAAELEACEGVIQGMLTNYTARPPHDPARTDSCLIEGQAV